MPGPVTGRAVFQGVSLRVTGTAATSITARARTSAARYILVDQLVSYEPGSVPPPPTLALEARTKTRTIALLTPCLNLTAITVWTIHWHDYLWSTMEDYRLKPPIA